MKADESWCMEGHSLKSKGGASIECLSVHCREQAGSVRLRELGGVEELSGAVKHSSPKAVVSSSGVDVGWCASGSTVGSSPKRDICYGRGGTFPQHIVHASLELEGVIISSYGLENPDMGVGPRTAWSMCPRRASTSFDSIVDVCRVFCEGGFPDFVDSVVDRPRLLQTPDVHNPSAERRHIFVISLIL